MAERKTQIKFIDSKLKYLSHEQKVQILHIIRPSVDLDNLIEKDGDTHIYYDKLSDDLLTRVHTYVTQCVQTPTI
jgi:hypothetical protein